MCELNLDNIFLFVMTGVSALIVVIDLKVLEKMFEEYFLLRHYLDHETYFNCYKPQAEMRMVFECYAIYCAILCVVLTGVLAFNMRDESIDWMARKVVNISFILFGPIMFTLCLAGLWNIKGLSKVCGLHGISPGEFNAVCVFLLFIFFCIAIAVSYTMAMQKTMDMAQEAFTNQESLLFSLSQMYFRYQ